mgnify:CR=1 FL=1
MKAQEHKTQARPEFKEMETLFLDGFGCESLWERNATGTTVRMNGKARRKKPSLARRLLHFFWDGG